MKIPQSKRGRAWDKQERKLATEGASLVPGSGNGVKKGDNKGLEYLVQAKTTMKSQFPLRLAELRKTEDEARMEDRLPVMQIQLEDRISYAVLPWEDFVSLLEDAGRSL